MPSILNEYWNIYINNCNQKTWGLPHGKNYGTANHTIRISVSKTNSKLDALIYICFANTHDSFKIREM